MTQLCTETFKAGRRRSRDSPCSFMNRCKHVATPDSSKKCEFSYTSPIKSLGVCIRLTDVPSSYLAAAGSDLKRDASLPPSYTAAFWDSSCPRPRASGRYPSCLVSARAASSGGLRCLGDYICLPFGLPVSGFLRKWRSGLG